MPEKILQQGAEALILLDEKQKRVVKKRVKKSYRLSSIDEGIRRQRTKAEAKLLEKASKIISIPKIIRVDEKTKEIVMEFIDGKKLSEHLDFFPFQKQKEICRTIGKEIAKLHDANIIHGDLTTSNMIYVKNTSDKKNANDKRYSGVSSSINDFSRGKRGDKNFQIFFIDFGLGFHSSKIEDKAVDLHLLRQALEAKHFTHWQKLFQEVAKGYKKSKESGKVLERLKAVEKRGRYKAKY